MNFYEKVMEKEFNIPNRFDLYCRQATDIKDNSEGLFDAMICAFRFGYMQGIRAERTGNAKDFL